MTFDFSHDRNGRVPVFTKWRLTQGRLERLLSGHLDHADGAYVETSSILSVKGNRVRTRNSEIPTGRSSSQLQ